MRRRITSALLVLTGTLVGAAKISAQAPASAPASRVTKVPSGWTESDRQRWNAAYANVAMPSFKTQPNDFLIGCLDRIGRGDGVKPQKSALDIAMGQGRNANLLAQRGYETTGIDISDVGIAQALDAAKRLGVKLNAVNADVFTYDYGAARWDIISVIYFNPARPILETFKRAIKPGGYIIIEGFGVRKQGGPPDESKFDMNELLRRFGDWEVLHYEDGDFEADWGGKGPAHLMRLLARKPDHAAATQPAGR